MLYCNVKHDDRWALILMLSLIDMVTVIHLAEGTYKWNIWSNLSRVNILITQCVWSIRYTNRRKIEQDDICLQFMILQLNISAWLISQTLNLFSAFIYTTVRFSNVIGWVLLQEFWYNYSDFSLFVLLHMSMFVPDRLLVSVLVVILEWLFLQVTPLRQ